MFSGWDVYRSEFPLLTIIDPKTVNDEINSLLNIAVAKKSSLPRWELMGIDSHCMVGDPGLIVLGDAFVKGIRNFDISTAYEICKSSSMSVCNEEFQSFRPKCEQYTRNAFVPHSLSDTLEYLMADYVMAMLAKELGKGEDYRYFIERAGTYSKNFNNETGFMGARNENGNFVPVKDEYEGYGCVESNIFQQSWFVPYDIEGLCRLFGRERFLSLLERLFEKADFSSIKLDDFDGKYDM
jgi:putative alpha-1,2-mannosidase